MTWIVPALLTLAGFAALALSLKKHHKAVFDTFPSASRTLALRVAGWLALIAATDWCIRSFGTGYGLVVETALLNLAGVAVALTLTYRYGDHRRPRGARNA
jgi:Protein of unknown function (DUF3325)